MDPSTNSSLGEEMDPIGNKYGALTEKEQDLNKYLVKESDRKTGKGEKGTGFYASSTGSIMIEGKFCNKDHAVFFLVLGSYESLEGLER